MPLIRLGPLELDAEKSLLRRGDVTRPLEPNQLQWMKLVMEDDQQGILSSQMSAKGTEESFRQQLRLFNKNV